MITIHRLAMATLRLSLVSHRERTSKPERHESGALALFGM